VLCSKIAKHLHQPEIFNGIGILHSIVIEFKTGDEDEVPPEGRYVASRKIFWGAKANYAGAKLFVYSDENDGIKCLYRYYILNTSRRVFYKFIMGKKH